MTPLKRPDRQPDDEFFRILRERYSLGLAADRIDREEAAEDSRFAAGGLAQWDPKVVAARRKARRPVLTEDRLGPSMAQIVNDGRMNKPSILCTPMDGGTEETAEYYQGRIRQIEYECDADIATDTAREQQISTGRGFYRVTTRTRIGEQGDEEVYACIEPIENQFSVVWDPSAKRYDLEDADWWFVVQRISKDEHERKFGPDTMASKQGFFLGEQNPAPGWFALGSAGEQVLVADYYHKDYDDLDDRGRPTVKIMATNGIEALDETVWIGSIIPVIPQFGVQRVVDDIKRTYSLIRKAKDPQRLVNLYVSNIAEQISQMPKNPYTAAEGAIAGREGEWETIHAVQRAVVQYKAYDQQGRPLPPPSRESNEPPIQALVIGYERAIDSVKAAMGIFDASLGAGPGEAPGVAIQQRRTESDIANFHFADNEARSRKKLGRILLEIIPVLDGTDPGSKPVRDADGTVRHVPINQLFSDPKTGKVVHHDLSRGSYLPAISTGPSYQSQREDENKRIGELIRAVPDLFWIMGDLYFATSDGPGNTELAERMKRAIALRTPNLIDLDQRDPRQQLQLATQKFALVTKQNQELVAKVHELAQILETRTAESQAKFNIEALRSWTQVRIAEIQIEAKKGIADADREGTRLESMFDRAHDLGMMAAEHAGQVLQHEQLQDHAIANAPVPGAEPGQAPQDVIPPQEP